MVTESDLAEALRELWRQARLIGFTDRTFLPMLESLGALATVRRLVLSPAVPHGFTRLWELKHLELTVEYEVLKPKWAALVGEEVRAAARARLLAYGMAPAALPRN
jgi:hypothetical protein